MSVGYIGLGAMGGAIAAQLLKSRPLYVFDRDPATIDRLRELGAIPATSPADLADQCDVVMLCVPRSADVHDVIFSAAGLLEGLAPGNVVIDQTSGDPVETRKMAALLEPRGVALVDAPVSGGPEGAQARTLAIMVGGGDDAFDLIKPVLEAISPNIFRCGGAGCGQVLKVITNTMSACNRFAMLEAVSLGLRNGLDLRVMSDALNMGGARSRATENLLPALVRGERGVTMTVSLMLKDLNLAARLAIDSGVPLQFGQLARGMLQAASHALGPAAKYDEIVDLIAAGAGTRFER